MKRPSCRKYPSSHAKRLKHAWRGKKQKKKVTYLGAKYTDGRHLAYGTRYRLGFVNFKSGHRDLSFHSHFWLSVNVGHDTSPEGKNRCLRPAVHIRGVSWVLGSCHTDTYIPVYLSIYLLIFHLKYLLSLSASRSISIYLACTILDSCIKLEF